MNFIFKETNCTNKLDEGNVSVAVEALASLNAKLENGVLRVDVPANYYSLMLSISATKDEGGTSDLLMYHILYPETPPNADELIEKGVNYSVVQGGVTADITCVVADDYQYVFLTATLMRLNASGVPDLFVEGTGISDGIGSGTTIDASKLIYPTGIIDIAELPTSVVGFQGLQGEEGFSHVQILVSEIHENGVGGEGRHFASDFFPKDLDLSVTLESVVPFCEGKELTNLNVMFYFLQEDEEGKMDVVTAYIVGGATTVTTFSVTAEPIPLLSLDEQVYCLDPVILAVNRTSLRETQYVRVEVSNYIADFEFYPDRNILEIDIAEYLQTLFANIDLFAVQSIASNVLVKLYDADWEHLETHNLSVNSVYGKKPECEIPDTLQVQWLDKFGALHDVTFKVFQNVAEGESKQKYVSRGEEHEDKAGERSISLAYVGANASQRIILETIVFADHVRAYFNGNWKRVRVENSYKHGNGREKRNFEITIKYSL